MATIVAAGHYTALALEVGSLSLFQIYESLKTTSKSEKRPISFKTQVVFRLLLIFLALSYVVECIVSAIHNARRGEDALLSKDDFVYLVGGCVFWALVGTASLHPWFRFAVMAASAACPELLLVICNSSTSKTPIFHLIRFLTLVMIFGIATKSASRQYQLPKDDLEREPLLSKDAAKKTASLDDDDGDSDSENEIMKKKQRERFESSGGWFAYVAAYKLFLPFLIPRNNIKVQSWLLVMLAVLLCERALNVLLPRQVGIIADKLATTQETGVAPFKEIAIWLVLKWLNSWTGLAVLSRIASRQVDRYSITRVTTAALDHVLRLSMDFHDDADSAELMTAVSQGSALTRLLDTILFTLVPAIVDLIIAAFYITHAFDIYVSFTVAVAAVVYIYLEAWLSFTLRDKRRNYVRLQRQQSSINHTAIEGWRTIVYFNKIDRESERYSVAVNEYQDSYMNFLTWAYGLRVLTGIPGTLAYAIVVCLIAGMISKGTLSVGSFFLFTAYWSTLWWPVMSMTENFDRISEAFINAERLLALFQTKSTVFNNKSASVLAPSDGRVCFKNVFFAYDDRKRVMNDVSFDIEGGKSVALVGETGSGKTTVLKLLHRFYDISDGSIQIDGHDVKNVTLESLRESIGIVPQDPILFSTTLMENVKYGRLDATDEEAIEACKAAAIHDKIMSFPDAYKSKVGARGVRLSGGEKQRIAIARCLLKNPRILLLDEATSAVDSETEATIQQSLQRVCAGRTTIAIAHRLSTIVHSDQILVMHEGEIVERGTHKELVKLNGRYTRLWNMQITTATSATPDELREMLNA